MKINFRKWICIVCLVLLQHLMGSWGFFAHKLINESATFSLPPEISGFFKEYIQYITEHAVDPDKRCYIDTLESPVISLILTTCMSPVSIRFRYTGLRQKKSFRSVN